MKYLNSTKRATILMKQRGRMSWLTNVWGLRVVIGNSANKTIDVVSAINGGRLAPFKKITINLKKSIDRPFTILRGGGGGKAA